MRREISRTKDRNILKQEQEYPKTGSGISQNKGGNIPKQGWEHPYRVRTSQNNGEEYPEIGRGISQNIPKYPAESLEWIKKWIKPHPNPFIPVFPGFLGVVSPPKRRILVSPGDGSQIQEGISRPAQANHPRGVKKKL